MDVLKEEKNDWIRIRNQILSVRECNSKSRIWDNAIDLFETSIENKYLIPLDNVQVNGDADGEGYSIVSTISILIEVLASYKYGKIFRHDKEMSFEYNDSKNLVKGFLKQVEYFKKSFEEIEFRSEYNEKFDCYLDYYWNVRCSLLHGGQLRNNWIISSIKPKDINDNIFIKEKGGKKVIYRNILLQVINQYFEDYITQLRNEKRINNNLRKKFARRLDWHFEIPDYMNW